MRSLNTVATDMESLMLDVHFILKFRVSGLFFFYRKAQIYGLSCSCAWLSITPWRRILCSTVHLTDVWGEWLY